MTRFLPPLAPAVIVAAAAVAVAPAALSQSPEEAEAAIGYRQSYMSSVGGHFGAVRRLVGGDVTHEGDLAMHADALAALTRDIVKLFPEGSGAGETDALPAIWENWEAFAERAAEAEKAGTAFAEAVADGDADLVRGALRDLGRACRGCHEDYKAR